MSFTDAKITRGADPREYNSVAQKRGAPDYPVSSSMLRAFAPCPARWLAGYEPPDTEAKAWGSLLDCYVLTPDAIDARYVLQPDTYSNEKGEVKPWNNNATACRDWRKGCGGRVIARREDVANVEAARDRLLGDEILRAWHDASDKQVRVDGVWHDEATGLYIPTRCLIDYAPRVDSEFAACLGDLKTTRNASPRPFARWCYTAGYHLQAAWNLDMWNAATGEARDTFCLVLSENYPPWQTGRRMLSQDFIQLGRLAYRHAISRYCRALASERWEGYDDSPEAVQGWLVVNPEPYMEFESASSAMEADQAEASAPFASEIPS